MLPPNASVILKSTYRIVDLPAPVLPTIPTLKPASILHYKFLRDGSNPSLYLIETSSNVTSPFNGHFA